MVPFNWGAWMIQGVRMKASGCLGRGNRVIGNEKARMEIQNFLKALDSYSESFARNPRVSFVQHRSGLMTVRRRGSGRAKQRGAKAQND